MGAKSCSRSNSVAVKDGSESLGDGSCAPSGKREIGTIASDDMCNGSLAVKLYIAISTQQYVGQAPFLVFWVETQFDPIQLRVKRA